jgi:hypothetical protein
VAARLGLVAVLVVLLVGALGATARPAEAYSGGPNSALTEAGNRDFVRALFRGIDTVPATPSGINPATGSAFTASEVEGGMLMAEEAAGTAPFLAGTASTTLFIPMAIGAAYGGWKIGSPIGGFIYKKLTGDTYGGAAPPTTMKWTSLCSANLGTACTTYTSLGPAGFTAPAANYLTAWYLFSGASNAYCDPAAAAGCTINTNASNAALSVSTSTATRVYATSGTNVCGTAAAACFVLTRTQAQMMRALHVESTNAAGYAAATATFDQSNVQPPTTTTDAQVAAGIQEIGGNNSQTGTAPQEAGVKAINDAIGDGGGGGSQFAPFILPQPLPDETYTAYALRLRERGWLGTLTVTADTANEAAAVAGSDYEAAPLQAPSSVTVGGTTVVVFDPAGSPLHGDRPSPEWPDNPPHIASATTPIALKDKPLTSVLPPPSGGGGGGGLDFSPITDLDPGCKFPYGLFCYAQDVTGWFDVSPDAPEFNFTINGGEIGGHAISGGGGYDVDLGDTGLDDYMAIWRMLLSIALWVGAVWMLASRLLGLNLGDPGEAVDDAEYN